jgi:hypothetical protein
MFRLAIIWPLGRFKPHCLSSTAKYQSTTLAAIIMNIRLWRMTIMPTKELEKPTEDKTFSEKDINRLVMLTKERSYQMPSGLSKEQRKEWAKTIRQKES